MFTGIVEELGKVETIRQIGHTLKLTIQAKTIMPDIAIGDSIAVNGVCLTVTDFTTQTFTTDVMPETFQATSLQMLQKGSLVNLERAMHANGRFGGHFVTGHVDGTGRIRQKTEKENAIIIDIEVSADLAKFLLMKGSVAVDGISLTVFGAAPDMLTVSIIPHTAKETVLGTKGQDDVVNLEMDMLAKYVHKFIHPEQEVSGISETFLRENGFA